MRLSRFLLPGPAGFVAVGSLHAARLTVSGGPAADAGARVSPHDDRETALGKLRRLVSA